MIKFIQAEEEEKDLPRFGDVEVDQFFVDMHGSLCQRHSTSSYFIIANKNNVPSASFITTVGMNK